MSDHEDDLNFGHTARQINSAPNRQKKSSRGNGICPPTYSEDDLALRFATAYADELRHVALWGKWLLWGGSRWRIEETLRAFDLARAICRAASAEIVDPRKVKLAAAIASAKTRAAVVSLASADRRHAATADQWDTDLYAINTPAGTLDRDGTLRPHNRADHITKTTAVSPGGDCPLWLSFLDTVTCQDKELQQYLQRVAGYCLTGSTAEHVLFFAYGTGANGKGVFINTVTKIWGDYAAVASMDTFIETNHDRHPTELAFLRGARLVTAQETEQGRRWAESKIKALTGGDDITARFMRQDFFTFTPQFKLVIAGNHKPSLRGVDEAIRRRFHLIPFVVTIAEADRDPDLTDKLRAEWGGILQWALDGLAEYREIGLDPPKAVLDATAEYLAGEDLFTTWVDDCCVTGSEQWGIGASLWGSWRTYVEGNNEQPGSRKAFAQLMITHGFRAAKSQEIRGYNGIDLRKKEVHRADFD